MSWTSYSDGFMTLFEQGGFILMVILGASIFMWFLLVERYWCHRSQLPEVRKHLRNQWETESDGPLTARRIRRIKALVGDRQRCFLGSLNLDPRALEINTENGLYIESPALAKELTAKFERLMLPENAWQVHLDEEEQSLYWTSSEGTVHSQPARHFFQRIADFFYRLLPIAELLWHTDF